MVQVLGGVQHHGNVAGLAGQAGAGPAHQDGRLKLAGDGHCGLKSFQGTRYDHASRHQPVIGSIRRIQRPVTPLKTYLTIDGGLQGGHHLFHMRVLGRYSGRILCHMLPCPAVAGVSQL